MLHWPKSSPAKKQNKDSYLPRFKRKLILALLSHNVFFLKVGKFDLGKMSKVVEERLDKSHKPQAVPLMNTQQGSVMTFSQVIVWAGHIRRDMQTVKDEDNKDLKQRLGEKYSWESQEKKQWKVNSSWMDRVKVVQDMRGKHAGGEEKPHRMFTWFNRENKRGNKRIWGASLPLQKRRKQRRMKNEVKRFSTEHFGGENWCDPDPAIKGQQICLDWSRTVKQWCK